MRRRARLAGLAGLALCVAMTSARAEAPSRSLVPIPRAAVETVTPAAAPEAAFQASLVRVRVAASPHAPSASIRPVSRDPVFRAASAPAAMSTASAASAVALAAAVPAPATSRPAAIARIAGAGAAAAAQSPRPPSRPAEVEREIRAAAARLTPGRVTQPGTRGALCGLPGLVGDRMQPITGRSAGCGIAEPVRLREVDGIALTTPATINCDTARALQTWVRQGLVPAVSRMGGGVSNLRVVASYACRTRNSRSGARLSEHARGNAIDIAGIGLADGSELTVLDDWRGGRKGRILRQVHQAACGPFGTVLGPNSDRFHRDHFHFDVAAYRSGAYCR